MVYLGYDTASYEPDAPLEAIPPGDYMLAVKDSEMKESKKDRDNQYLQVTIEVIDGEYQGRLIFDRFNIINKNTVAEEIGRKQLAALCEAALNKRDIKDSNELHFRPFIGTVDVEKSEGYNPKNVVKRYMSRTEARVATEAKAAPAVASKPSWGAKK